MIDIASEILHKLCNTETLEKQYCTMLGIHVEINAEHSTKQSLHLFDI